MLKSELEKAAREFCIYQSEIPNQIDCFEAGAKWALEWVIKKPALHFEDLELTDEKE